MEYVLMELRVDDEFVIDNRSDPQLLLNAVLNNRKSEIDDIIRTSTKEIIYHKHEEHENKCILLIACADQRVSHETLNILCQSMRSHGYDINYFDEDWYKWEPLHYVAREADSQKLQVLLNNYVRVNSLTSFSENALHVLLEYQQCIIPFDVILYNSTRSTQCMVLNTEKDNIFDCALKLIEAGVDVNHSNLWNETPICIAVRYRFVKIIELLFKIPTLDIDNFRVGDGTVRSYLKQNCMCQDIVPQSTVLYENPVKILFNYLKSGNEQNFIQFNNGNIKDYIHSIDSDFELNSNSSVYMLQLCFRKGYVEYLQHDLYDEKITKYDIMDNLMFNVFCLNGLSTCIDHLLNNGADPKLTSKKFSKHLLEAAAVVGYYPLVAMLLQHKYCTFTADDIFEMLPRLFEHGYRLMNHEYYGKSVLSLLLSKLLDLDMDKILSDEKLDILNNILLKLNLECDDDREDDSENICRILRLGASLAKKVEKNTMIIQCIHPEILKSHFDDCLENNRFYYGSIVEDNSVSYSETRVLYFLANNNERNQFLRHPLLVHYVHNKWLRNFYFFYINLVLYYLFLLSIYTYMVSSHIKYHSPIISTAFYTMLALHSLKECIQMVLYRFNYFLNSSNYLELTVIVCCFVSIFYWNEFSAVTSILFSTVLFVMLVGQEPMCAKFTIIFGSTKYFLQYAGFYFIQFVAFALVFYLIFPVMTNPESAGPFMNSTFNSTNSTDSSGQKTNQTNTFGNIFKSLFYTLIFFTGEYSDEVLESGKFPVFGKIIMAVFIFCMTIILNNLLVGLIVADMNKIQRAGKLQKQVKIANFIARMNSVVKRLYEFKTNRLIKQAINFLHIFEEGKLKTLDLNQCKHAFVFDEENLKYLKSIRSKSNIPYNKDLLQRSCTRRVQKANENLQRKIGKNNFNT